MAAICPSRPSASISICQIRNFCTLPVNVIGKESMIRICCGILNCAIFPWK